MEIVDRVQIRLKDENISSLELLEMINTIEDRICLRIGEKTLPEILGSVVADAVVKMYRRQNYEGISSEGAGSISTSFVNDILEEYDAEFEEYKKQRASTRKVRFI